MLNEWTQDFTSKNTVYCKKTNKRELTSDYCLLRLGIQLCLQDGREGVYILREDPGERR